MKKIIGFFAFLLIFMLNYHISFAQKDDIYDNFYYNKSYIFDKKEIIKSLNKDIKKGISSCVRKARKYFTKDENIKKYCFYQIKHYLYLNNHPLSKKYKYYPKMESSFFLENGKNLIDNFWLIYLSPDYNYTRLKKDIEAKNLINYNKETKINKVILKDFEELNKAHKNIFSRDLKINSSYRSLAEQRDLYNWFVKQKGKKQETAVKAGFSEHHLGTTLDFARINKGKLNSWQWLDENGRKFGFVKSYNKYCLDINISCENWHWRRYGKEIARKWKTWSEKNPKKCNILFLKEINKK